MSFTYNTFYNSIVPAFITTWNAAYTEDDSIPIALDNQEFSAPVDNTPYVRLKIMHNGGRQASHGRIGNRTYFNRGFAILEIKVPKGDATGNLHAYCKTATDFFRELSTGGIHLQGIGVETIGVLKDGVYYQVNVQAEFRFEEIA